jgi:hypothetical protein
MEEKRHRAIGDIHGRPFWKHYVDGDFDDFFILGDYFDSYRYTFAEEMRNFREIIDAAGRDARIKLLLGNHDFHYLLGDPYERYSRFNSAAAREIARALRENLRLFHIVEQREIAGGSVLISHAGVSDTFMALQDVKTPLDLNECFKSDMNNFRFNGVDVYGDDATQSPLWIRPRALLANAAIGFSQIVGHTPMDEITTEEIPHQSGKTITFIDTFENENVLFF